MNVAVLMGIGEFLVDHKHFIKLLGAFRSVFQHGAHGGIAVDIRVFAFDIRIFRRFKGNILINPHQIRIHFSFAVPFRAVEDIGFGRLHKTVGHQNIFHDILNIFHAGSGILRFFQFLNDFFGQHRGGLFSFGAARSNKSFDDGLSDFIIVKGNFAFVSFNNRFYHFFSVFPAQTMKPFELGFCSCFYYIIIISFP